MGKDGRAAVEWTREFVGFFYIRPVLSKMKKHK